MSWLSPKSLAWTVLCSLITAFLLWCYLLLRWKRTTQKAKITATLSPPQRLQTQFQCQWKQRCTQATSPDLLYQIITNFVISNRNGSFGRFGGPQGSRMPYIERVSQAMFELKTLESSEFTEVLVYGSHNNKLRAKWMFQSIAERYRLRQERGMLKLEEAMKTLELGQC